LWQFLGIEIRNKCLCPCGNLGFGFGAPAVHKKGVDKKTGQAGAMFYRGRSVGPSAAVHGGTSPLGLPKKRVSPLG